MNSCGSQSHTLTIIYTSYIFLKILKPEYGSDRSCYKDFFDLQALCGVLTKYMLH